MAEQNKKTIYVGGLPDAVDEASLVSVFQPFGDIIEVQLPRDGKGATGRHRGFGFVTFSARSEAEDAIDNMHLNTIALPAAPNRPQQERVLTVHLAKPMRTAMTAAGNRAVWASEEWIKQYGEGAAGPTGGADAAVEAQPAS